MREDKPPSAMPRTILLSVRGHSVASRVAHAAAMCHLVTAGDCMVETIGTRRSDPGRGLFPLAPAADAIAAARSGLTAITRQTATDSRAVGPSGRCLPAVHRMR